MINSTGRNRSRIYFTASPTMYALKGAMTEFKNALRACDATLDRALMSRPDDDKPTHPIKPMRHRRRKNTNQVH